MKKAMVQSQAIMYVLAMIIIASILIFGFKSISSFKKQGDSMQMIKFKQTVIDSIDEIRNEYGSVEPLSVLGVDKYLKLCFYSSGDVPDEYPLIDDSVSSGAKENAFLVSDKGMETAFYVGKIDVEGGFLCIDKKAGHFDFVITGEGDSAKISLE